MSFVFPTNASQVQAFAGALYGVQVGTTTMAQVNADIAANGGLASTLNSYYSATFGGVATSTVAATVAANLGLTGDALTSGAAYVEAQLNAAAAGARGAVISSIVNLFGTLSADATFGAAATAWNAKVATAAAYTGAANVAVGTVVAQNFVLTTGVDSITGTSGNDTIIGDNNTTAAADQINGGGGVDTLKLYGTATLPTLSGIENLYINGEGTVNAATSGVTSVEIDNFTVSDTVTLAAGQALTVNRATGAAADLAISTAATVTSHDITVIASGDATNAVDFQIAGTGVTNLNLTASGSTKSYVDIDFTGTVAKTVAINASSDLVIENIEVATTIDASASTGKVELTTAVNKMAVTGGSGADKITLSHADTVALEGSVNAGAGDDSVVISSLNEAADLVDDKVTLNGGEGTDNITMVSDLAIALGGLTAAAYAKKGISGFEKITISDVTADADAINFVRLGISSIDFAAKLVDSNTFTVLDNTTLELSAAADAVADTATITVSGAADAGRNNDTYTLVLNGGHAAADTNTDYGAQSIANVENINIVSKNSTTGVTFTTADNEIDLVIANAKKVTVTGDFALDIDGDAFDGVIETFDASALTGTLAVSFAGGAGVTATGSATKANTIVGSSNADLITGGAGGDTITGGNGKDVINLGAAGKVDTINLNEVTANANADTISGFDATGTNKDVIQIGADETAAGTAHTAAAAEHVIGAVAATHTANDVDIVEFAFESAVDLSTATDGAQLLKGISNSANAATFNVDADDDALYVIAYSGGNAYLYYASESNDAGVALAAADIALVGIVKGVAVGSLSAANFDLVA